MYKAALLSLAVALAPARAWAAEPVDTELPKHHVTWTTPSTGITESMPIGNGRVAALVWAEKGGDLMVSVATGDAWDENARSIRTGNVRFALSPNPFANGKPFEQVLDYKGGEITFKVGDSPAVALRVWVDANQPVVHVEASGATAFQLKVTPELWRTARQNISQNVPWKDFIHVAKDVSTNTSSLKVELMPDVWVTTLPGKIGWYHRNETSHWAATMTNQSIDVEAFGVKDPLTLRTMGATVQGTNLSASGHELVAAEAQTKFRVDIAAHTNITEKVDTWLSEMDGVGSAVFAQDIETLRAAHAAYWDRFWNRSYVFVTGNTDADNVTNGWIAARYLMGCQSRAEGPLEFNGGLFSFQDDVKLWHDYTQANQQFAHWSMLPSGDFDLIQSWFDMLLKSLPVGRAKTKASWNHDGAMFAEHMILYGPQSGSHYGWDRTGRAPSYELAAATRLLYGGVVENAVMMLDTYEYTGDADFAKNKLVPFASEIVKWYDQHWQKVGGKIRMSPIYSGERDKNVTNSMVDVAGLTKLLAGLLALPEHVTTQADRAYWQTVQGALPALPISGGRLRPAEDLAVGTDTNNQNLAPIFPMRMIGPGKPELQVGIDSYNNRTGQAPRDGTEAWRHDAAHAAYLGLANEARTQVIGRFTRYKYRYQGFVNGAPDGDHCIEPIAVGKIGLQAMLMHPGAGKTLNVLNAWPSGWNAQFKLWGPQKTWVAGNVTGGKFTSLTVSPRARVPDVLIDGAAPTVAVTGSDEDGGYVGPTLTPDPTTPPTGSPGTGGTSNVAGSAGASGATNAGGAIANGGAAGQSSGGVTQPGGGAAVANPATPGSPSANAAGCGCRLGSRPSSSGGWLLSLGALLLARRRATNISVFNKLWSVGGPGSGHG